MSPARPYRSYRSWSSLRASGSQTGFVALVALVSSILLVAAQPSATASAVHFATTPAMSGPINPAAIPLGDGYVSTSPKVGYVDSCVTSFNSIGGASVVGPWIDETTKTWDSETKLAVQGSVSWPSAKYSVTKSGSRRIVKGNDEPIDHKTGVFPIGASDPAHTYDQNPNRIEPQTLDWSLPLNPKAAKKPSCTSGGTIGILDDGVVLFNALDGEGRDAGAHEVLDSCDEHPQQQDVLHHHSVPACILDAAKGRSTLVGYALDGYGIYVERNANGSLLTNTQLDACHGRTSKVLWNGKEQDVYHYDATLEYPYTVGCFHGTPITAGSSASASSKASGSGNASPTKGSGGAGGGGSGSTPSSSNPSGAPSSSNPPPSSNLGGPGGGQGAGGPGGGPGGGGPPPTSGSVRALFANDLCG